jgi:hypothetical protein
MSLLSPSGWSWKLDIETGVESLAGRVGAVPIRNDDTFVTPFFSKDTFEEVFALGNMSAVDLSVSLVFPGVSCLNSPCCKTT